MTRRPSIYYSDTQKVLMWDRWKAGDTLHQIAHLFDRSSLLSQQNTGRDRRYLPEGVDISAYSQARLNDVARKLNERPRKTLDFSTPAQMYNETVASTG